MKKYMDEGRMMVYRIPRTVRDFFRRCFWSNAHKGDDDEYSSIVRYFIPEFIIALLLFAVPFWFESYCVNCLESTSTYATLGAVNTFMRMLIKLAEALMVGTTILCGRFNGMGDRHRVGETVRDGFWLSCVLGLVLSGSIFWGAQHIYMAYGYSLDMAIANAPVLRIRALSILFQFMFFALVGFFRGIKKPHIATAIFFCGSLILMFFDYTFILGNFGCTKLGLKGIAFAALVQNLSMLALALGYIMRSPECRAYAINLIPPVAITEYMKKLFLLSLPVALDKVIFAASYIWIGACMCAMGKYVEASFYAVRDMESFALLPGVAFAQVVTYLVSNCLGQNQHEKVKQIIKKVMIASAVLVAVVMAILLIWQTLVMYIFFDKKGAFSPFAQQALPFLCLISFLDLVQLILAGALRGAGDVKTVMYVRVAVLFLFFFPLSSFVSSLVIENQMIKFLLIYATFYTATGLMALMYAWRLHGNNWNIKVVRK